MAIDFNQATKLLESSREAQKQRLKKGGNASKRLPKRQRVAQKRTAGAGSAAAAETVEPSAEDDEAADGGEQELGAETLAADSEPADLDDSKSNAVD